MLGKRTFAEWFSVPAKEVVERFFRSVLLATNMSSYVPKCAKETSDPYFRCYQQNNNNLTHACMHFPSFIYHADFVCQSKEQTSVVLSNIFCLNQVPNVYSTAPV